MVPCRNADCRRIRVFRLIITVALILVVVAQRGPVADAASPYQGASETIPPVVTKQFEETSYYLADVVLVTPDVGWAVGQPHWDQSRRQYVGTIIKTTDGGGSWVPQETDASEAFNAACFLDENQGWVVGARGVILHTTDGGQRWTRQAVATEDEFRSVAFVDDNLGWATTVRVMHQDPRGEPDHWATAMWHTVDGGNTWTQQAIPENASVLNDVQFLDGQVGWAVGSKLVQEEHSRYVHAGVIYNTVDGGTTWHEIFSPDQDSPGATKPGIQFTAVDFVDASTGWVVGLTLHGLKSGEGLAFRTIDSGRTWQRFNLGSREDPLLDVEFLDGQRGFIVSGTIFPREARVHRTMDGGATWADVVFQRTGAEFDPLRGVAVVGNRVVAVGDHDYLVRSDQAWDVCPSAQAGKGSCEALFTQSFINTHYRLQAVSFVDDLNGWAVGSRSHEPNRSGQVILHTSDGGANWELQYEDAPLPDSDQADYRLDSVYFVDAQMGWAVGNCQNTRTQAPDRFRGAILHTVDGGRSWQQQGQELYEEKTREFYAVRFLDNQNGWALAVRKFPSGNVFLAHTTDGGIHWNWVDSGVEGVIGVGTALVQGDVEFVGSQHGWAVGGLGTIIRTTDGGATWEKQQLTCDWPQCPKRLFALSALSERAAWISGEGLYYTMDGGYPWKQQLDFKYPHDIHDVQFLSDGIGWLAGGAGAVMYTNDGGASWHPVGASVSDHLLGLSFVNPQLGWAVGEFGVILRVAASQFPPPEIEIQGEGTMRPGPAGPGGAPPGGGGVMVIVQ